MTHANPTTAASLQTMTPEDLEMVLSWRNDLNIRKFMYNSHEITADEHQQWFTRSSQDPFKHLLIFNSGQKALGFVNFNQIRQSGVVEWGFYVAPSAPKGTGMSLRITALQFAFTRLGFHKICGEAIANNERSIKFHLNAGFKKEGILRDQHYDGSHYQDVICFGLLAEEWQLQNGVDLA